MRKYSPQTANTFDAVCSLRSDNKTVGDSWILTDGTTVTIVNQKNGEAPTEEITLDKDVFNRMVRWYRTPTRNPRP